MTFPVLKGASYILVHTPDMIVKNGTTCAVERETHPESEFLKEVTNHIRSYEEVVNYIPNQVYIGNNRPEELREIALPWCEYKMEGKRDGKRGEIMPQDEFLAMMQICDAFDLVKLKEDFVNNIRPNFEKNYPELAPFFGKLKGDNIDDANELIDSHHAEGLYHNDQLVGYVKRAHDVDVNLNAHTMFENLVVKASGVVTAVQLIRKENVNPLDIDYVIECSEEACGDMN
ncbi:MAG: glycine reductase, partial [Peptostreptococcaceae bacterium]|nr:glycine reductase [Peptostreptococcaceae bacterium]